MLTLSVHCETLNVIIFKNVYNFGISIGLVLTSSHNVFLNVQA